MSRVTTLLVVALILSLAACSSHISRDITDDGRAGQLVFPDREDAVIKEGSFPGVDALSQVGKGMNKGQLYNLLGRPHFHEGFVGVREWDYLFHFREGETVRTCQYKLIFDENYRVGSMYWLPEDCASVLKSALSTAPVQ